jgi:hypothetical protein
MIATVGRKFRTLVDTLGDFWSEPLASLRALDHGLEDRRQPVSSEILNRVVAAYRAAKRDQPSAGTVYQANGEWAPVIEKKVKTFESREFSEVLETFFRNETFVGLCDYAAPAELNGPMSRVLFVNHMLHDYRVWLELTGKNVEVLQTPWAGNPFGYFIGDTLAIPASFRHHYMAEKIVSLIGGAGVVAELGGGYGELAYFALRSGGLRYLDFDLPEVLLVASYWLCSAMPAGKIALYGEDDPQSVLKNIESYDAILFPNFSLPLLPDDSVDVFLNTRSLSEMEAPTIQEYLTHITRTCRKYFLHENSDKAIYRWKHQEVPASAFPIDGFRMLSKTMSPWKAGAGRYREYLYERGR